MFLFIFYQQYILMMPNKAPFYSAWNLQYSPLPFSCPVFFNIKPN